MPERLAIYKCEVCGIIIEVLDEGAGGLTCCRQEMRRMEAKTDDSATEKHVPSIEETDGGLKVRVGENAAHPMEEKHFIKLTDRVYWVGAIDRSDIATELLNCGALIIGTPTLNSTMFPTIADVLTYIRGLKPINKVAAAFGSFGWGGEAVKQAHDILVDMGLDVVGDGLKVKYVPDESALAECRRLGTEIAKRMVTKVAQHV